jgi:hypothetical protein
MILTFMSGTYNIMGAGLVAPQWTQILKQQVTALGEISAGDCIYILEESKTKAPYRCGRLWRIQEGAVRAITPIPG